MTKVTNKQIIAAMQGSAGIMGQMLSNLKILANPGKSKEQLADIKPPIHRNTLYERIGRSKELKDAYEAEKATIDDLGESAFAKALQKQEKWAVNAWLKYRGRTKDYIPAMKMDHTTDDKPLPTPIVYLPKELPYDMVNQKLKGAPDAQDSDTDKPKPTTPPKSAGA